MSLDKKGHPFDSIKLNLFSFITISMLILILCFELEWIYFATNYSIMTALTVDPLLTFTLSCSMMSASIQKYSNFYMIKYIKRFEKF